MLQRTSCIFFNVVKVEETSESIVIVAAAPIDEDIEVAAVEALEVDAVAADDVEVAAAEVDVVAADDVEVVAAEVEVGKVEAFIDGSKAFLILLLFELLSMRRRGISSSGFT